MILRAEMNYKTKSVIIGRMKRENKDDMNYPCFVSLFYKINNPHTSGKVPDKILDFKDVHKIIIDCSAVNYLLAGNDLVINNLKSIDIKKEGHHIHVKCRK